MKCHEVELYNEYKTIRAKTLLTWEENASSGDDISLSYAQNLLGVTLGNIFEPCSILKQFLDELKEFSKNDSKLKLISEGCYHFTFLALSSHEYQTVSDIPNEVFDLKNLIMQELDVQKWSLDRLEILPLNNCLLLVGIPNDDAYRARYHLAQKVLASSWSRHIKRRYGNFQIPPVIWHTTIARYEKEFLPSNLRNLYFKFQTMKFDKIYLESPRIKAVTFDWSKNIDL